MIRRLVLLLGLSILVIGLLLVRLNLLRWRLTSRLRISFRSLFNGLRRLLSRLRLLLFGFRVDMT